MYHCLEQGRINTINNCNTSRDSIACKSKIRIRRRNLRSVSRRCLHSPRRTQHTRSPHCPHHTQTVPAAHSPHSPHAAHTAHTAHTTHRRSLLESKIQPKQRLTPSDAGCWTERPRLEEKKKSRRRNANGGFSVAATRKKSGRTKRSGILFGNSAFLTYFCSAFAEIQLHAFTRLERWVSG